MGTHRAAAFFVLLLLIAPAALAGDDDAPPEAMRAYFAGMSELAADHPAEAVLLFKQAIAIHPTYTHAFYDRGRAYQAMGLTGKAAADYTKTLELDGRHAGALRSRAILRVQDGEFALAAQDLTRLLELLPKDVEALRLRARARMLQQDYKGARLDLKRAIAEAPDDPGLHYRLGLVHGAQGKVKEAAAALTEAVRLDPKNADAWHMLGVMRAADGQLATALDAYAKALDLQPNRANTHAARGAAYAAQGLWLRAISALRRAQALDPTALHNVPDSALLRTLRAVAMLARERDVQADLTLEIAVLLDESAVRPRLLRWVIAARREGRDAASKLLRAWLDEREKPPDDEALDRIARYLVSRVNEDVLVKRAQVGDPIWFYVGVRRELAGDTKGAKEAWERCALAVPPRCPEAFLAKEMLREE